MAWYLYIVRTPTIAKNRHLNIVLQAELFVRTGTYDRPKLGKNSESSWPETSRSKNPYPWRSTPIHVWPATSYQFQTDNMGDRTGSGKGFLTHFLMKHLGSVGTRKKRPASRVFFFLPAFGRYCAFGAPPSQLDRPCAPPGVPRTTGSTLRLSTYRQLPRQFMQTDMDDRPDRVGERFLNPLRMKHHLRSGKNCLMPRLDQLFSEYFQS